MNTYSSICRIFRNICLGITLVSAVGGMSVVNAYTINVTGEFKPDPSNLDHKVFKITSVDQGFCFLYPATCQALRLNSLRFNQRFRAGREILANNTDPRQGAMFQINTLSKSLTITNILNGEQKTVELKIRGLATKYEIAAGTSVTYLTTGIVSNNYYDITQAHIDLWSGGNWNTAPSPCTNGLEAGNFSISSFNFNWRVNTTGVCAKQAKFDIPASYRFEYPWFEILYEIIAPNPLQMSSGTYTGTTSYTVRPQGDFDLGDVMATLSGDTVLTLNFTLAVLHTLKIEIPPGGNRVELLPQGGWQQWLQSSRVPEKLFRDQSFLISASTPFKMQMTCEKTINDSCGLTNAQGNEVPLKVYVTLPAGLGDSSGAPVNHKPLLVSGIGTDRFVASRYVDRTAGILHFEIERANVVQMLTQQGPYRGNVTVIWDSEI